METAPKTSLVDAVDLVGEPSQSSDIVEADQIVVLDTTEQDTYEPSAAPETSISNEPSDTSSSEIDVKQEPSTSSTTTEPPQTTPKDTEPQTVQKVPTPPVEPTPKTERPAETTKPQEPEPTTPSEPEKPTTPKTAYDYDFDIDQIRKNLIALAQSYGLTLDESLDPNNASWANPVFATENTQGDRLKRLLNEYVQYYADRNFRASMGLSDLGLTIFNIYCELLGNGVYRISFLNY